MAFIIHLRPACAADCEAIFHIHYYAVRLACHQSYDATIRHAWLNLVKQNQYLELIDHPHFALWVAEYYGKVMGFFQLNTQKAHLAALYVHPFENNRGIGTAMLQRAEEMIIHHQFNALSLYSPNNAVGFFRLNDYQTLSEAWLPLNDETKIPCRLMRKNLQINQ